MERLLQQDSQFQQAFEDTIRTNVQKEVNRILTRMHPRLSAVVAPALAPLIWWSVKSRRADFDRIDIKGEDRFTLFMAEHLDATWMVCPNVVVALGSQIVAQLDHLIIGPAGLYVVDTVSKSAMRACGDAWQHQTRTDWGTMGSPTTHTKGLVRTLQHWMAQAQLVSLQEAVMGVVVLLGSSRLRVADLPMSVVDGPSALTHWLMETDAQRAVVLSTRMVEDCLQRLQIW